MSGEKLTTDLIFLGQTELALKVVPKAVKFVHSLGERSAVRLPGNPSKSTVRSPLHTVTQSPSNPPPLPTKHNCRSKPTQLQKIATFTSPSYKHIFPFLLPPWRKTQLDYGKCFTIHQSTTDKDKVVAHHNSFVNQAQYRNTPYLLGWLPNILSQPIPPSWISGSRIPPGKRSLSPKTWPWGLS